MDKSKYFLDLSKCTEEEQRIAISLLLKPINEDDYDITHLHLYLIYDDEDCMWWVSTKHFLADKTELTYPEFIKLFEGGEDYPGKQYQPLFDHLNSEHGLILHESEMDEIIRIVNRLNSNQ